MCYTFIIWTIKLYFYALKNTAFSAWKFYIKYISPTNFSNTTARITWTDGVCNNMMELIDSGCNGFNSWPHICYLSCLSDEQYEEFRVDNTIMKVTCFVFFMECALSKMTWRVFLGWQGLFNFFRKILYVFVSSFVPYSG